MIPDESLMNAEPIENSEAYKTALEIISGDRIEVNVREMTMARGLIKAVKIIKLQRALLASRTAKAHTKATAQRCVEICEKDPNKYACVQAIKQEFGL